MAGPTEEASMSTTTAVRSNDAKSPEAGVHNVGTTTFGSLHDLANALRRTATARGEHEKRTGSDGSGWPDWCAAYAVAERAGPALPT
jgi:hypothetical protein